MFTTQVKCKMTNLKFCSSCCSPDEDDEESVNIELRVQPTINPIPTISVVECEVGETNQEIVTGIVSR